MGVMPKPAAPEYRTTNWPEYNAALKRRGSLEIWFNPQMHWLSKPCGRSGRPMRFSDSAIERCLTLKSIFNLPLRPLASAGSGNRSSGGEWARFFVHRKPKSELHNILELIYSLQPRTPVIPSHYGSVRNGAIREMRRNVARFD